jgi:DNA-binding LytR/AlgR family response regulator
MRAIVREGFPELEVEIRCPIADAQVKSIAETVNCIGRTISGEKNGKTFWVDFSDVLYFETVDRKCFIYTEEEVFETNLRLYEIEALSADASFFRSSKSQIVNIARICSLCPDFDGRLEISLKNGEKIIVSRQYAKQLKERIGLK